MDIELLKLEQRKLSDERFMLSYILAHVRSNYDLSIIDMENRIRSEIKEKDKSIELITERINQFRTATISQMADWYEISKEVIDEQFADRVKSQRGDRGGLPDCLNR